LRSTNFQASGVEVSVGASMATARWTPSNEDGPSVVSSPRTLIDELSEFGEVDPHQITAAQRADLTRCHAARSYSIITLFPRHGIKAG
jgi:hypothetical protein